MRGATVTFDDLEAAAHAASVTYLVSVRSHPFDRSTRALPDNIFCAHPVADQPGRWLVFYTERGEVFDEHEFATEDAACRWLAAWLRIDLSATPRPAAER